MHRHTTCRLLVLSLCLAVIGFAPAVAQDGRPASPEGSASTQIGDAWIDITYSRPILRGRSGYFGAGDSYGQAAVRGRPPVARRRERDDPDQDRSRSDDR